MRSEFLAKGTALPNFEGVSPLDPAIPGVPQPGKKDQAAADINPRTKSRLISWGLYIGGGIAGGLVKLGLKHFIPSFASGATPLVNIGTQIAMSPGQQAIQMITGPMSVWAYTFVKGKEEQADPSGVYGVDPAIEREFIALYGKRAGLDSWVTSPVSIFNDYKRTLVLQCEGVRRKLEANQAESAGRLLGATLRRDKEIWGQFSPASAQTYEKLYIALHSFFEGRDPAMLAEVKKHAVAEALRLDGGKDKNLAKYVESVVTGLTTGKKPPQLDQPWGDATVAPSRKGADAEAWARELIEHALNAQLSKVSGSEAEQLKKQFTKAIGVVQKDLIQFETQTGRQATHEEVWRMTQAAFEENAGKSVETRMALISVAVFAVLAGAASFGNVQLLKILPAWAASGVGVIAPTLISYLSILGRFGVDKFVAFGRALGWAGTERATLGKGLDREFRNMKVRTTMFDRRAYGLMGYLTPHIMRMEMMTSQASRFLQAGKIDMAAAELAGLQVTSMLNSFYFWPFGKVMHSMFDSLGPYFDGITQAQRDELTKKVLDRVKATGVRDDFLAAYHKPFITGLLGRNVKVAA